MNDTIIQRALMGIRKNNGKTVKLLGHTNNGIRLMGMTNNVGLKMSHTKTKC